MTELEKAEIRMQKMKEDYKKSLIPKHFNSYFEWKLGNRKLEDISQDEASLMMQKANDLLDEYYEKHPHPYKDLGTCIDNNPWQSFEGFGEDKYIVCYLGAIDDELSALSIGGYFS